ncbi:MAG TPA: membrane protein insertase YidC, partial [Gemmatimonadales bacterium]|nr:membrane protein insertase YidC [Gemmatimonadales bacterium]
MDRRAVWAIVLMMAIALVPALFLKQGQRPAGSAVRDSTVAGPTPPAPAPAPPPATPPSGPPAAADTGGAAPEDTVLVTSPLYTYGVSTRGARVVVASPVRYPSMAADSRGRPVQLIRPGSGLLGMTLVRGRDTLRLADWTFEPSARKLDVTAPTSVRFAAAQGDVSVELSYAFTPDDYRIGISGRVTGVGPNGGLLLLDFGPGLANTEADSNENHRALALVTKQNDAERTDFSSLKPGDPKTLSGPFEWVAVKSKYFVTALLAFDSASGGVSGVTATAPPTAGKHPIAADIRLSLPVNVSGNFNYALYAGPMEYDHLRQIGHDFDDVNPYGWPGFRTVIRFFTVPIRWLLVFMHQQMGLAYGIALIIFGVLVRLLLWPLNQKAMRSSMQMQAIQPHMKELQERHKDDPQRLQTEMMRLYKEHGVNPFGGCWPMLLPMPILLALFFVFQNTIELRGASFLWLPDLSRPDPYYIIPVLMGLTMYGVSRVGQIGMEQTPQMRTMLYIMPVMMTVLFLNFASGLNLYYAVQNITSIPQQWILAKER